MGLYEEALALHEKLQGKIEIISKAAVKDVKSLSLVYSPGVAEPCRQIRDDVSKVFDLTGKGNTIAVVSDGSAVLGLGNIGPEAALPVMEGKCVLFKTFAGVNAIPICLSTQDPDEIVEIVKKLEPNFGGINLEDITAPACFLIEERLKAETEMAIFHDDQHGTAVVAMAGLLNALRMVGKKPSEVKVVINGAGAAGTAIAKILIDFGVEEIVVCDRAGIINKNRPGLNPFKKELATITNKKGLTGGLAEALVGADVFIGVSVANVVSPQMVRSMAKKPVIFALANPEPEILPEVAYEAGACIVATGRSDYPNQVNNVLGFPGIFRGALDVRAREINDEMKRAAAIAIAGLVSDDELTPEYVIPKPFDPRVAPQVAMAVAEAAIKTQVARKIVPPEMVAEHTRKLVERT